MHRKIELPIFTESFGWSFLNFEMDSSKNFICEICEKTYSTTQNKDQHISIVHGEVKKFECNVCSKTFGHNIELTNQGGR